MAEEEAFVQPHWEEVGEANTWYSMWEGSCRRRDRTQQENHLLCAKATLQKTRTQASLTLQQKRKENHLEEILYLV